MEEALQNFLGVLEKTDWVEGVAFLKSHETPALSTLTVEVFLPVKRDDPRYARAFVEVTEAEAMLNKNLGSELRSSLLFVDTSDKGLETTKLDAEKRWESDSTTEFLDFYAFSR